MIDKKQRCVPQSAQARIANRFFVTPAVATAAMAAVMTGVGSAAWAMSGKPADPGPSSIPESIQTQPVDVTESTGSLANMIAAVKPAVVNISVTGHPASAQGMVPPSFRMPPGSPFNEFFRKHFGQPPHGAIPHAPAQEFRAAGSGFIISSDGYVVTNNHVIQQADQVTVILDDGKRYQANVKGRDPKTDLALLKIKANKPLPYVTFGDSNQARVGDRILAIGNPFGLGGSATTGIISARGRDIKSGPFDDFIQIDAPINQGNSGGPLFDMTGKVVGINTAIFSPNGGNVGIGFAIPSDQAQSVITQLRSNGHVERGWLGVQIQSVTTELAESMNLPREGGALVASVVERSPAARAGVKVGDVIVSFNGQTIDELKDLTRSVARARSDQDITVEVWRAGKKRNLDVVIGKAPNPVKQAAYQPGPDNTNDGKLGLAVVPLNDENRQQFHLDGGLKSGAVIVDVRGGSPAAKKGLRPGDVITRVGQNDVAGPQDLVDAVKRLAAAERDKLLLLVNRQGDTRFITLDLA